MKKFTRQKSGNADKSISISCAAAAKVAHVFEPGEYRLRIESARVVSSKQNVLVALDLIETEGGGRVAKSPLWVEGPNAGDGQLVTENQHLVAQLLTLAGLPTAGNVGALIPQLTDWSLMRDWCSPSTVAAAAPTTRIAAIYQDVRHDGRTDHVRRRRSAAC